MPAAKVKDNYANKAYGKCIESAPTTLTFTEIPTNTNIMDKVAWVLHRIEWYVPAATMALLVGDTDSVQMALTCSKQPTALGLNDPAVIDMAKIEVKSIGAAASVVMPFTPYARDFSGMPGGGLIIAPRPLYVAVVGFSIAAAATAECRLFYSQIELDSASYIDMIDFYRIIG